MATNGTVFYTDNISHEMEELFALDHKELNEMLDMGTQRFSNGILYTLDSKLVALVLLKYAVEEMRGARVTNARHKKCTQNFCQKTLRKETTWET
jgi:hypothetical protein